MVKCIYTKCETSSNNSRKKLFKFPKDEQLLEKWKQNIPLVDFENVDLKKARLCQDHFKESLSHRSPRKIKLSSTSIPELFDKPKKVKTEEPMKSKELMKYNNVCRMCLRKFLTGDVKTKICSNWRRLYASLTGKQLRRSMVYSQEICQRCSETISKYNKFKNKIIKNQEILHRLFEPLEEHEEDTLIKNDEITLSENNVTYDRKVVIKEETPLEIKEEIVFDDPLDEILEQMKTEDTLDDNSNLSFEADLSFLLDTKDETESDDSFEKTKKKERNNDKKEINKPSNKFNHIKRKWAAINGTKGPRMCDFCGSILYTRNGLLRHMKLHMKSSKPFPCDHPGCKESYYNAGSLRSHRSKHFGNSEIYCEICGKKFLIKANYDNHIRSAHTKERPFLCRNEGCDKTFYSQSSLRNHEKNVHTDSVTCPTCGKLFKSSDVLRKHIKYHQEFRFVCDFENCGKQCINKSVLKMHKKVHLGQRDMQCPHCPANYHAAAGLRKHIRSVHMKYRIPCDVPGCSSNFTGKETYRVHAVSHHKNLSKDQYDALLYKIRTMKLPKVICDNNGANLLT